MEFCDYHLFILTFLYYDQKVPKNQNQKIMYEIATMQFQRNMKNKLFFSAV